MLCDLGGFVFDIVDKPIEAINKEIKFNYAKIDRIANNPLYQAVKGEEESFTILAKLIKKSNATLKKLEDIARKKEPVRFTLGSGESFNVIIEEIKENRTNFVKGGYFIKDSYNIKLRRVYD